MKLRWNTNPAPSMSELLASYDKAREELDLKWAAEYEHVKQLPHSELIKYDLNSSGLPCVPEIPVVGDMYQRWFNQYEVPHYVALVQLINEAEQDEKFFQRMERYEKWKATRSASPAPITVVDKKDLPTGWDCVGGTD